MHNSRVAAILGVILVSWLCYSVSAARSVGSGLPSELQGLRSTHHCAPSEPGQHLGHRVCYFSNLLLLNGSVVYCGPDAASIPSINVEYWLGKTLQEHLITVSSIDLLQRQPQQVVTVNKAVLLDWTFYHNYFHVFAEYLPTLHNLLCKYWNDCSYSPDSDLDIVLLTDGIDTERSRNAVHNEATKCVTSKPISALSATDGNTHTAVLIKEAIVGWGPECRSDHHHCLPW